MWEEVVPLRTVAENKKFRLNEYRVRAGSTSLLYYAIFEYLEWSQTVGKKRVPRKEWKQIHEMLAPDVRALAELFQATDLSTIPGDAQPLKGAQ